MSDTTPAPGPDQPVPPHGGSWILDAETGVLIPNAAEVADAPISPAPAPDETPAPEEEAD